MTNTNMSNGLSMHWLPVTDETGRTHMEAVWVLADAASASHAHAA